MTTPTKVQLDNPEGVLSVVPLLLGYQPGPGNVVLLGLNDRGRAAVTANFRQPLEASDLDALGESVEMMRRQAGVESAIIVGYGDGQQVTPSVDVLRDAAASRGVGLRDALRAEGDRYWSYTCEDTSCCPPEGRQFQADTEASTKLRVEAGASAEPSRDDIAARFAAPTGPEAEAAQQAWAAAPRPDFAAGRRVIDQALADCHDAKPLSTEQAAGIAAALTRIATRDYAWAHMAPEQADEYSGLWASVMRHIPAEAAAAPASLLAFCSWQRGDGATANLAVDRALETTPNYSMARLLGSALQAGAPPSAAILPMTPEEVIASYEPQADYDLEAS